MKLSKKSKELMLFFTKNSYINKVSQTKRTDSIIMDLYKDIYNAYKYLNSLKQKGNYSNSFPEIIRKHIDELTLSEIIYNFSLYGRMIKLYFIVEEDNVELKLD